MKIRSVTCFQVSGAATVEPNEERQLQMLDIYPEYARRGASTTVEQRVTGTYVQVSTDDGAAGLFGPIFDETAPIISARAFAPKWFVRMDLTG